MWRREQIDHSRTAHTVVPLTRHTSNQAGMRALAPLPDSASRERTIGEVLALLTGAGEEATA
jgi:hypothetical protein